MPEVYLEADGIVRIDYSAHDRITLEVVRKAYQKHCEISLEAKPVLIFGQSVLSMDDEAAAFVKGHEVQGVTKAAAILSKSVFEEYLGNRYLAYNTPPFPTRLFTSQPSALRWLHAYQH